MSVTTARAQTSASVPFVPLKPQNKIHTNMSLPLIYNHRLTHLDWITKKHRQCDMLNNIYHGVLFHSQASAESLRICSRLYNYFDIDVAIALQTFLYDFHVNKLNSMYNSNRFVMSYMLFLACFTKCSVKCTHRLWVTLKRNVSTSSKKYWI